MLLTNTLQLCERKHICGPKAVACSCRSQVFEGVLNVLQVLYPLRSRWLFFYCQQACADPACLVTYCCCCAAALPVQEDFQEAGPVYGSLCGLVTNAETAPKVANLMPQIVQVSQALLSSELCSTGGPRIGQPLKLHSIAMFA